MKKHIQLKSIVCLTIILAATVLPFSRISHLVFAQDNPDNGYNALGNPCPDDEVGTSACDFDSNGNPIPTGPIHTGSGGTGYQLPPIVTTAHGCPSPPQSFRDVLCTMGTIVNTLLPIVVACTVAVFFWGIVKMIYSAGDQKAVEAGKKLMIWGIVGLFVMISIWGILSLFLGDFGSSLGVPQLPESNPSST